MAFSAVAFSPNNPRLVAGDHQGNLTIIDTKLLRLETTIPSGIPWIRSISFSPDGSFLAIGGSGHYLGWGEAVLWNFPPGQAQAPSKVVALHTGYVYSIAFSPSSPYLVTASGDGKVKIWDIDGFPNWARESIK